VPSRKTGAVARAAPAPAPAPGAKLVCTAGPGAGQEFVLEGDEVVIGRATDVQVSIADTSVSRRHALVRPVEGGWAVSDLGSGNGTLLNNEAVGDETTLNPGDLIALGDSEFRFESGSPSDTGESEPPAEPESRAVVPSRARPPVRTSRTAGEGGGAGRARPVRGGPRVGDPTAKNKPRRLLVIFGGLLAVVMAVGVSLKAIGNRRRLQEIAQLQQKAAHDKELAAMLQEAKNFVRLGKWEDGKAKLLELREADEEYEAKAVQNYLDRAEQEIPNQKAMAEAAAAVQAGHLGDAARALAKVKSTIQEDKLSGIKDALTAAITQKISEGRALQAQGRDLAKMEALKSLAEDILAARPDDRDGADLKRQAEDAINRIKNPNLPPPPPETPHLEVMQRFRSGDESGAMSLAQACSAKNPQCRTLEAQIKEFDAKLKNLESLNDADLLALYLLDKKIGGQGSSSELAKPIKTRLAASFYLSASKAKTSGNWSKAIEYARRVLDADPSHPGAQTLIGEARNQAKDVYLRGYQLKDNSPDEAAKLFKDVLNMTPSDDEYHQKADARLSELQTR
jgi:pSer/pThr/pTyr-binding forkhead associated (FHA) protein